MMLRSLVLLLSDVNQEWNIPNLCSEFQTYLIVIRPGKIRQRLCLHNAVRKHLVHTLPRLFHQSRFLQHLRQPLASWRTVHGQHIARVNTYRKPTGIGNCQFCNVKTIFPEFNGYLL